MHLVGFATEIRSHCFTVLAGFRLDRKRPYPNDLHENDADEANGPGLKRLIGVEKNTEDKSFLKLIKNMQNTLCLL